MQGSQCLLSKGILSVYEEIPQSSHCPRDSICVLGSHTASVRIFFSFSVLVCRAWEPFSWALAATEDVNMMSWLAEEVSLSAAVCV